MSTRSTESWIKKAQEHVGYKAGIVYALLAIAQAIKDLRPQEPGWDRRR